MVAFAEILALAVMEDVANLLHGVPPFLGNGPSYTCRPSRAKSEPSCRRPLNREPVFAQSVSIP
jgi:hypothetical protein